MAFDLVNLDDDELIIRLIKRRPSEKNQMPIVRASDFDRLMDRHSGISMYRLRAKEAALAKWIIKWPKGVLIAPAKPLKQLGLSFYHTANDHFSIRCYGCDLGQNQKDQRPLCTVESGICQFAPPQMQQLPAGQTLPLGIRDQLALIFTVETVPQ